MKIENLQDFVNPARKTVYLSLENCISLKTIENVIGIGHQTLSRLNHYHLRNLEIFYLCENDE